MSIKLGAVGAGAWGQNIVRTLHAQGVLGVVAETSPQLREKLASELAGLAIVSDYADLLHHQEIDAVTIATPAATHHKIARDFLLAGKDVFVEKPMTLTSDEARDLIEVAAKGGRILMTGHLLLYKPALEFIRNYLESGALGKIFTFHQERMKLGRARSVENALWSLGVHDVAALLFLAGEAPVSVSFAGHCGLQQHIEDDTYLHMTFANGMMAHLHNSWLWPEDSRCLRIIGEKGMLVYNEKAESVTLLRKYVDRKLENVDEGRETLFEAPPGFQPLAAEMRHFIDCVETRSTPRSCGNNGLNVLRVLEQTAVRF